MPCAEIVLHDSVELQDPESELFALHQAVPHEFLADPFSADLRSDSVACVADMPAAPDVVRMQDIEPQDAAVRLRRRGIGLRREKVRAALPVEIIFLRKGNAFLHNFIPDPDEVIQILLFILSYRDLHIFSFSSAYPGAAIIVKCRGAFFNLSRNSKLTSVT